MVENALGRGPGKVWLRVPGYEHVARRVVGRIDLDFRDGNTRSA